MKWTVAEAGDKFADLLQNANKEPQSVFNRNRFVAAVIDAETFEAFEVWRRERRQGVASALDELGDICREDGYRLEFHDEFDTVTLDENKWFPYYLPHWSKRERSKPHYSLRDNTLQLRIDKDQGFWSEIPCSLCLIFMNGLTS
jgi:PHD/YefM family antitoxin component YafN of YafNO toxin-antitoxin module